MANFNTHIGGSVIGCGIFSALCYNAGIISSNHVALLWVTGLLAGLLPDVDSSNSISLRIIFNTFSIILSALLVILLCKHLALLLILLLALGLYLFLRWIALPLFKKTTVHRGAWHSLLMGLCASTLTTNVAWHLNHCSVKYAWLLGLSVGLSFLIHLLLDEIHAVDLSNIRIKESFGTACKLFSKKSPVITCIMLLFLLGQLWLLPPFKELSGVVHQLVDAKLLSV